MIHVITSVQSGEVVPLLQPIDNRDGQLRVALRQLTYTVGWYNVVQDESFSWRSHTADEQTVKISPGLWSFRDLKQRVTYVNDDVELEVNRSTGLITLTVPEGLEVKFSDGLLDILGLDDGKGGDWLNPGTYLGDRPVQFSPTQTLRVHLDQLSTSCNFVDGAPSTLLTSVGATCAAFSHPVSLIFEHPLFKPLQVGTVGELKLTVRDDNHRLLDNHSFPFVATLELSHARS